MNSLALAGFSAWSGYESVLAGLVGTALLLLAFHGHGAFTNRHFARAGISMGVPEHLLVGAGTWSLFIFLCGWMGNWNPLVGTLLIAIVALAGIPAARRAPWRIPRTCWPLLPAAFVLLITLATPTVFWDSRAYHLAIPEYLSFHGSLVSDPAFVYGWYPQAMECLYTLCVPFGETAARLVNVAFLVAAAAVAGRTARTPLAVLILLSMPAMLLLAYAPKNSGLLALAGIVSFERALSLVRGERTNNTALLAGMAAGIALATHYAAIWHLVFLIPLVIRRGGLIALAYFVVGTSLFAAPTYIRNALLVGNPTYPFLGSIFGTVQPAAIHSGVVPGFAAMLERFVLAPWTGIESLGIGSTLGLVLPAGLCLAWLFRRERPVPDLGARTVVGLGLLAVGTTLYGFARFGIVGIFLIAPVAAAGFDRWPRAARWACTTYALAAAVIVLTSPFDPLIAGRLGYDAYRERFDAAWSLTATARALPPGSRIASVGVLRSQGWGGRLEPAGEDYAPAIARALQDHQPAATLKREGFTHLAVDFGEVRRLRRQYGYLAWDTAAESRFIDLLANCRPIAENPGHATLLAL